MLSNKELNPPVVIGDDLVAIAIKDGDLLVKTNSSDDPPVAFGSFVAHTGGGQGFDLETPTIQKLLGEPIPIENQDRFPNAKWIETPKRVGTVGEESLFFLGVDDDGFSLVGKISNDTDTLFAVPINELIAHATEKISIPKPFRVA